jgi:membrane protein DedA with SNARE-associated domain
VTEWITRLIHNLGYVGLTLLTFLENVFPPIPSEIIMPLGGFLVAQGELTLVGVVLAGTLGSILGGLVLYALGGQFNQDWLKGWVDRHGHWMLLTVDDIDKAFEWFDRHGTWAVFFARLVPGVRSLISIPAGTNRMNLVSFLLFTALGTAIWSWILACGGVVLGARYERFGQLMDWVSYLVIAVVAVAAVRWFVNRKRGQV